MYMPLEEPDCIIGFNQGRAFPERVLAFCFNRNRRDASGFRYRLRGLGCCHRRRGLQRGEPYCAHSLFNSIPQKRAECC
jgi:hypothetical protein